MKYKKYDYDGYKIFTIQTDKFKNCYLEVDFREDARCVDFTKRSLLSNLLGFTSLDYPTKREMRIAQEELYNVSFGGGCSRAGYNFFTDFSIDFLNPKYVLEENYLEDVIAFLFRILKRPNKGDGSWDERSFEIIKEREMAALEQYKERPLNYAMVESKSRIFSESISSKRIKGTTKELEIVTKEDMVLEYEKMFQDSHCDILIIGDLDMDFVVQLIKKYFHKASIVMEDIPFVVSQEKVKLRKDVEDSTYQQTQLLVYYQFDALTDFEFNFVVPLFTMILGSAGMTDKLTKYLREENSLCYYCGCGFSAWDSYSFIYTGLKKENIELALKYIHIAMDEMKNGDISLEYLEKQKEKFLSDLSLREDNMYGLIDNYYFHEIANRPLYEDYKKEIQNVSIKDLQQFARKMYEVYEYVLEEAAHEGN